LLGSAENAEVRKCGIGKFGRNVDKIVNGQRRSEKCGSVEIFWHITPAECNQKKLIQNIIIIGTYYAGVLIGVKHK